MVCHNFLSVLFSIVYKVQFSRGFSALILVTTTLHPSNRIAQLGYIKHCFLYNMLAEALQQAIGGLFFLDKTFVPV